MPQQVFNQTTGPYPKIKLAQMQAYKGSKYLDIVCWGTFSKVVLFHVDPSCVDNTIPVRFRTNEYASFHSRHFFAKRNVPQRIVHKGSRLDARPQRLCIYRTLNECDAISSGVRTYPNIRCNMSSQFHGACRFHYIDLGLI